MQTRQTANFAASYTVRITSTRSYIGMSTPLISNLAKHIVFRKGYPSIGMFSSLNVSWLRYSGPPQGGLRNTTSADRVWAIDKKSAWMNSILSATPYTSALFLAHSSLASSISIAITASYNRNQSNTGRYSNDIVMQIHVATVRGFTLCGSQGELL